MANDTDIELISSLDQPMRYDPNPVLKDIEDFYTNAKANKDLSAILEKAQTLIGNFRASGLGLAKILYNLCTDWSEFEVDDNFEDTVFQVLGISKTTIDRYVTVWSMFAKHMMPKDMEEGMKLKPMKALIPIAKAIEQGYEWEESDWKDIMDSPDEGSIRNKLRDIKGIPPRKGGLMIVLQRDGDLKARIDGSIVFLGWLNVEEAKTNENMNRAIERIVSGAGIVKE